MKFYMIRIRHYTACPNNHTYLRTISLSGTVVVLSTRVSYTVTGLCPVRL